MLVQALPERAGFGIIAAMLKNITFAFGRIKWYKHI
jgi:hypothetical protein